MPLTVTHLQTLTGHRAAVFTLSQAPQADSILSGCGEGLVASWSIASLSNADLAANSALEPAPATALARIPANVFSLCWLDDTRQLLVGGMHGGAFLLGWQGPLTGEGASRDPHPAAGKVLRTLSNPNAPVFSMLYRPHDHEVWMACGDGVLRVYDSRQWTLLAELAISRERLRNLSPEPNGDRIAVCASDGCVYLVNGKSRNVQQVLQGHEQSVFCASWTADGTQLITGSRDARLRIWQGKGELALDEVIPAHLFTINAMTIDPTGRWLATASRDKTIKLWSTRDFRLLKVLERPRFESHSRSVNALMWHEQSGLLVSASDDRTLKVWQVLEPTLQNAP